MSRGFKSLFLRHKKCLGFAGAFFMAEKERSEAAKSDRTEKPQGFFRTFSLVEWEICSVDDRSLLWDGGEKP